MSKKPWIIAAAIIAITAIITYILYQRNDIKLKLGYIMRSGYRKEVGKQVTFSTAAEPTSYTYDWPVGTIIAYDVAQDADTKFTDAEAKRLIQGNINDLISTDEFKLRYARVSWNELPGKEIRDFTFSAIYEILKPTPIQRISDSLKGVTWLTDSMLAIDRNGHLVRAVYILT
jgi:hypothetical protein